MNKRVRACQSTKIGYGIVRVSSAKQAEVQHGSLEQQRHMIERWAKDQSEANGQKFQIAKVIEEDISGKGSSLHKRKGLRELERAIEAREIDFFVAEKVDRIARDQIYNLSLVKMAQEFGVEVYEIESGLIDFRDRGSRLGFNIKNMLAEDYVLELEEKVTKKGREARVNNGKDKNTVPILGLDPHPSKSCVYVRNEDEIKIVKDIFREFLKTKSHKSTIDYCNAKGYKTKARMTKSKIDRQGNIVPPRRIGGEFFSKGTLGGLLKNPKYRGCSKFEDTWNQFPQLQDENGMVRWDYAHGVIIDEMTAAGVDTILSTMQHRHPRRSKYNGFLLTGILMAEDGSRYHGDPAKSGANPYYYNKAQKKRIPCQDLDELVINRAKEYLDKRGVIEDVINKYLKHKNVGVPFLEEEKARFRNKLRDLGRVIESFSDTLRQAALAGQNVAELAQSLLDERKKAEGEQIALRAQLEHLEGKTEQFKRNLQGISLRKFLERVMTRFEKLPDTQKKQVIQAVVPKAIVRTDGILEIYIDLDPENRHKDGPGDTSPTHSLPMASGADSVECKSWGLGGDGGTNLTRTGGLYDVNVAL